MTAHITKLTAAYDALINSYNDLTNAYNALGRDLNRAHSLIHAEAEQKRKAGHLRNRVEGRIESLIQGRARSRGHDFSR